VGLILGGVLTDWASWRWVLWINVPVGAAIAVLTGRFVRDGERQAGQLDIAGALTSTMGVTALVYGFIRASVDGWTDSVTLASFAVGAVLLGAFALVELRAAAPVTPLRLFASRDRLLAYAVMMLLVATVFGSFFFLAQFLQEVRDYTPLMTGVAFIPLTGIVLLLSGRAGELADRLGYRPVVSGGVALVLGGALWITQISASTEYVEGILGPLVLMGVGISANIGTLTVLAMSDVDERDSGAASGLVQVMQQFGISIGLAVLVTVFGTASRNASGGSDDALAEGIGAAYVLGSAFAATGLVLALFLSRRGADREIGDATR
jgi:MFS family permease